MTNNAIEQAYQTLEAQANQLYNELDAIEKAKDALKPMLNKTANKVAYTQDANNLDSIINAHGGIAEWRALERKAKGKNILEVSCQTKRNVFCVRLKDWGQVTSHDNARSKEILRYNTKEQAYKMKNQLTAYMEAR